jgi:ArsR family transcriptional regulator
MDMSGQPVILERMTDLADGLRGRILLVLERHELTVSELCDVLQSPQSTVSRHLKTLSDGGWVNSRPDGTSRLYRMRRGGLAQDSRQLWLLIRTQLAGAAVARQDEQRLAAVLAERRSRSREFFASGADDWDRLRDELFGRRFYLLALPGLLDPGWVVGDLGCGTGRVSQALAPWVDRVVAVDESEAMLDAARARLEPEANVELRLGRLESLPIADGELDAATLVLVLHHVGDPAGALREVARVLRPGGRLLLVDMQPHERLQYREEMGHVWLGFAASRVVDLLAATGFEQPVVRDIPAEPDVKGPVLFAAGAVRADPSRAQSNNEVSSRSSTPRFKPKRKE